MSAGIHKESFPIGVWVNLLERNNYTIRKNELAGIYYIKNYIDGQGYIGLSHNLHSRLSHHIHILKYKDEFINKPDEYLKENKILNFHQQLWKYKLNEIEICILWAIDTKTVDRVTLDQMLSEKERYYIKMYDTAANGYNMSRGGIDGVRTLNEESHKRMCIANKKKATNGDNRVFCFDLNTKERFSCITKPALEVYIKHSIYNDMLHKFSVVAGRYLVARDVETLEDRIQYYYNNADLCGKYHNNDIPYDIVVDLYKGISCENCVKKYNISESSFKSYQKRLNMIHTFFTDDMREYILSETDNGTFDRWNMLRKYAIALKTIKRYETEALTDGWSYINKKKEDNNYINSKDYFFVVSRAITPYEYFMYRYDHELKDTLKHFNITISETGAMYEAYNNMYFDKFKDMYINGNYLVHYTDLYTVERKTIEDYTFIDIDSNNNMYKYKYGEEYKCNNTNRFPLNTWINFTDRFKYEIPSNGVAGVFYIRNTVDGKGYIFYSHDLFRFVSYHTSIIDSRESYNNCSDELCENNNVNKWHRELWKFDKNEIEMCILYEVETPHFMKRDDVDHLLQTQANNFIKQYDTINNGYNGFSTSTNALYCYDSLSKKRFCCSSSVHLGNYINKSIQARQYLNNSTLLCFERYIISRTIDNLEEKIKTYYEHCDPNGIYHVEYISNDIIEELFKTIDLKEVQKKYNISSSAILKYRKCLNIVNTYLTDDMREYILSCSETSEITPEQLSYKYGITIKLAKTFIETALSDGWSIINEHKSSGAYDDSSKWFMFQARRSVNVYDYFMYRLSHSIDETQSNFDLSDDRLSVYERYNEINKDRLKSLYIDGNYPYNYWVSESMCFGSADEYEIIK